MKKISLKHFDPQSLTEKHQWIEWLFPTERLDTSLRFHDQGSGEVILRRNIVCSCDVSEQHTDEMSWLVLKGFIENIYKQVSRIAHASYPNSLH